MSSSPKVATGQTWSAWINEGGARSTFVVASIDAPGTASRGCRHAHVVWEGGRRSSVAIRTLQRRGRGAKLLIDADGTVVSEDRPAQKRPAESLTEQRTASECVKATPPKHGLTDRAKMAAQLAAEGLTSKRIAERMGLSHGGVNKMLQAARQEGYSP